MESDWQAMAEIRTSGFKTLGAERRAMIAQWEGKPRQRYILVSSPI
jgi:hypothetical protein